MNKKDVLITIGICAIGWAAFPIILKLVENRRKKKKDGSENEAREVGSAPVEKQDAGGRSGKSDRSKLLLGDVDEKEKLLK